MALLFRRDYGVVVVAFGKPPDTEYGVGMSGVSVGGKGVSVGSGVFVGVRVGSGVEVGSGVAVG